MARLYDRIYRSLAEFLAVPLLQVAAFLVAAWLVSMADASAGPKADWPAWRRFLDSFIGDPSHATDLMATIATSLVTVSAITFSVLLLAVQQSSAALTNQIVDQYMRRRANQTFFGFFVGSSLFAMASLGLTKENAVPVLAAVVCLVLAVLSLCLLVIMIYSTLDQTRPSSIVATIHDSTVTARQRQRDSLARTRNTPPDLGDLSEVRSESYGYVAAIDFAALTELADAGPDRLIVIERAVGAPVCHGQTIARVAGEPWPDRDLARLRKAIHIDRRRELASDVTFGVDQLGNIAWTAVSTAKSNPAAGLIAIHALNDLLFRWGRDGLFLCERDEQARVICRDTLMDHLACAYESLMVVASESLQHQSLAEVGKGMSRAFADLPGAMQDKLERAVIGSLSALGDHVPTDVLCKELERLEQAFRSSGRAAAADKIERAWKQLAQSRGMLHSRSDRVPHGR